MLCYKRRLKGESLFLYNSKTHYVKPGDILYIPEGSNYIQESKSEDVIYIHFTSYSQLSKNMKIFSPAEPSTICALFEKCFREYSDKDKNYQYRCISALYEILSYIDLSEDNSSYSNPCFESAIAYFNSHIYSVGFSIDLLCRECKISRTYFNLLFKQRFNITPVSYINTSRIKQSKNAFRQR